MHNTSVTSWDFPRDSNGILALLEAGRAREIPPRQLLRGTRLHQFDLEDPDSLVDASDEIHVARNLIMATGPEPGLGAAVGSLFRVSSFGVLGFALLTSPSLLAAMKVAASGVRLSFAFAEPQMVCDSGTTVMRLGDDQIPADVRDFFIERDLAGLIRTVDGLSHGKATYSVNCSLPGASATALQNLTTAGTVYANREHNELRMDSSRWSAPLPEAEPRGLLIALRACSEALKARSARGNYTARVRAILAADPQNCPTLATVASKLHLNERTLRRHLTREGTAYRELRGEILRMLADQLLSSPTVAVEDVALSLGYADAASFTHAYTRWTGCAPGRARSRL